MSVATGEAKPPIDFYFDFISGYGYFASLRIEAVAARHGRRVDWRCMLLGVAVMKVMGLKPLLDTPMKGDYVMRDAARYMRRHGLVLARQVSDPMMDPRPAARAFCWVKRHQPGSAGAFVHAAYDRYWRLGRDLSSTAELLALAGPLGLDEQAFKFGLESEESRTDLRSNAASSDRHSSSSTASPSGAPTGWKWLTSGCRAAAGE